MTKLEYLEIQRDIFEVKRDASSKRSVKYNNNINLLSYTFLTNEKLLKVYDFINIEEAKKNNTIGYTSAQLSEEQIENMMNEAKELYEKDKLMTSIKIVRKAKGITLKEAKIYCDKNFVNKSKS